MINKKGDLARILLPILAFALSTMAIYAIVISNNNLGEKSSEFSELISELETTQIYIKESSKLLAKQTITSNPNKETLQTLALSKPLVIEGTENFLGKLQRGEFEFITSDSEYTLKITQLTIKSKVQENTIERLLNLCLIFDKQGNYLNEC